MSELLNQPEYLHVLFNPVVTHALPLATLLLVAALFIASRALLTASLMFVVVAAAWAWPTIHFGQAGHDRVEAMADSTGEEWLAIHMRRAEFWEPLFYAAAGLALTALLVPIKWSQLAKPLAIITAVLAVAASIAAGYIANPAGKIRHKEFRNVDPPVRELMRAKEVEHLHEH